MSKQAFQICFLFKRIFKLRVAEPPEEIEQLFDQFSENGTMSVDNLLKFMIYYQKEETAKKEDAQEIFNSLRHLNIFQRKGLHFDAFFRYLYGDHNLPIPNKVHHDMDFPLAHYFLYTGHNSYLTGNQLSSDSSSKPIIKALRRGVRVIELDLWPNSEKNDVEVCHGGTLTAPVDLNKCLHAIRDHAFDASEYPVVITFEDHLPPNLQDKVAKMVAKTFGTMLYRPESENLEEFPSPNSLKRKILISTKPPKEYLQTQDSKGKGNAQMLKTSSKKEVAQTERLYSRTGSDTIDEQGQVDEGELIEEEDEENAVPEYRNLIAIHATKLKDGLAKVLGSDQSKAKRLSMSEQQLENAIYIHGSEIVRFTQRNLLRIYPKGTRILSTNYDPHVGWGHGAQMVAFNMQGTGKYLWIMQGMFRANGGCGYVKKPEFLLKNGLQSDVFDPNEPWHVQTHLKVKIYQGEGWHLDFGRTAFDQCSPPDFFIKLGIAGVPADTYRREKSRVVVDQWAPVWNEEFTFPLAVPELAVLRIEVFDYDQAKTNDFAGQTCLPVSELKSGIRAVPLHDEKGDQYRHTRLLMRFQFD
ncbi:phosphoinositide phospholipase C 2 [Citrus sinensis]|uniref:Phosphoinositide phospholipase C 2 n=1 Tax=Citrus sinensis TaxID=2711 RepID=A0ACB8IXK4_CITSI|nr:phosphoinositide phospholipase C 2 [Citrus sinensis]